jgi:hypothetical protein
MGIFSDTPGHRFYSNAWTENNGAVGPAAFSYTYYQPWTDPVVSAVPGTPDANKFFYGQCNIVLVPQILVGAWEILVTAYYRANNGVDMAGHYLYKSTNVINPVVEGELIQITAPMMPCFTYEVKLTASAASSISVYQSVAFNGIYFGN